MYSGPHHNSSGNRLASRKVTIMRRLGNYRPTGPSGVRVQSVARIRAPISPPPARNFAAPPSDFLFELMRDLTTAHAWATTLGDCPLLPGLGLNVWVGHPVCRAKVAPIARAGLQTNKRQTKEFHVAFSVKS